MIVHASIVLYTTFAHKELGYCIWIYNQQAIHPRWGSIRSDGVQLDLAMDMFYGCWKYNFNGHQLSK